SSGSTAGVPDAGAAATYDWSIMGGTITSGAGTKDIVFDSATTDPVTLSVTVTSAPGCLASSQKAVPLRIPPPSIDAPAGVCAGSPGNIATLQPDYGSGTTYFWTIANGTLTGGLGTRTVTFVATGGAAVELQALVFKNGCAASALVNVPADPPDAAGP